MVACRWHISLYKYFYINYNAEFSVYKLIFLSTNSVCFKRLFFSGSALSVVNLSQIFAPVKRVHNSRKLWDCQCDFCFYINKQYAILRFLKLQGTYISYKKGVLDLVMNPSAIKEHPAYLCVGYRVHRHITPHMIIIFYQIIFYLTININVPMILSIPLCCGRFRNVARILSDNSGAHGHVSEIAGLLDA